MKRSSISFFNQRKTAVVATDNIIPLYNGQNLYNVKPANQVIQFNSTNKEGLVSWESNIVTITHHLNCYPLVTLMDNNKNILTNQITILDASHIKINFSSELPKNDMTCILVYGSQYGTSSTIKTSIGTYLDEAAKAAQVAVSAAKQIANISAFSGTDSQFSSLLQSLGSFAVLTQMPYASIVQPNYILYTGSTNNSYTRMHLYSLLNTNDVYSWKDEGLFGQSNEIQPYKLPASYGTVSSWLNTSNVSWNDSSIISQDKKIEFINWTNQTYLIFPSIISSVDENNVRTIQVWIKLPGNEVNGISNVIIPSEYTFVNEDDMPQSLIGQDDSKLYTYHIFVMRFIPKVSKTYVELAYSHAFNTDGNY